MLVRGLTGSPTPPPLTSDAVMAESAAGVLGVAYIQVRHLLGPWFTTDTSPPDTLTMLTDEVTRRLRAVVMDTVIRDGDGKNEHAERSLSYDIYIPEGAGVEPPEGFELLAVKVYRRRVC